MPTKIDPEKWAAVQERTEQLLMTGMPASEATRLVSREFGGVPAPGTIMNRWNRDWAKPGSVSTDAASQEFRDLQTLYETALSELEDLHVEVTKLRAENEALRASESAALQRAARAEGAAEVLRDVVDLDTHTSEAD